VDRRVTRAYRCDTFLLRLGLRSPRIVVHPGGQMSDEYTDHLSILKFIEAKWRLPMISDRSSDLLNPVLTGPTRVW
jgi:hypothetical protein